MTVPDAGAGSAPGEVLDPGTLLLIASMKHVAQDLRDCLLPSERGHYRRYFDETCTPENIIAVLSALVARAREADRLEERVRELKEENRRYVLEHETYAEMLKREADEAYGRGVRDGARDMSWRD